jgi:hypothetical protein
MDSVGQLIQSLSMLDSQPSDPVEPHDDCSGSHGDSTVADTEGCENFETSTNSYKHVDRSTISQVSADTGSGDEPPEERPATLKRRYLTTEECNMLVIVLLLYFFAFVTSTNYPDVQVTTSGLRGFSFSSQIRQASKRCIVPPTPSSCRNRKI